MYRWIELDNIGRRKLLLGTPGSLVIVEDPLINDAASIHFDGLTDVVKTAREIKDDIVSLLSSHERIVAVMAGFDDSDVQALLLALKRAWSPLAVKYSFLSTSSGQLVDGEAREGLHRIVPSAVSIYTCPEGMRIDVANELVIPAQRIEEEIERRKRYVDDLKLQNIGLVIVTLADEA